MTELPARDPFPAAASAPASSVLVDDSGGSIQVKQFYDEIGWVVAGAGVPEDTVRFGVREVGELRDAGHQRRLDVIRSLIAGLSTELGQPPALLECGCGGNPALWLAQLCRAYTGVDFSHTGLDLARKKVNAASFHASFVQAGLTELPFSDSHFDAVYSAHALYHIPTAQSQAKALDEIMRVIRPGGVAILVLANPRPLLFPLRLIRRLIADTPGLSAIANIIRKPSPLSYQPMPLGWMRRVLSRHGRVDITCHALASVWVNQNVTERRGAGRLLWKSMLWLERSFPHLAAYLGNYVLIAAHKAPKATKR